MHDEELKKRKKILEKYQELGSPARNILTKIVKKPSGILRGDLKKSLNRMNDKVLRDGTNQLLDFKIIKREEVSGKVYYSLDNKHKWQLSLIARKQSDKLNLDSYGPEEIINESTSKGKTTIYGLNSNVFRAVVEGSRNTDINKKETLDFVRGIKAKEMFGEYFGVPLGIKIRAQREKSNEKEIIDKQRDHYLDLVKKGMRIIRKSDFKEDRKTRKKGKIIKVDEEVIKDVIEDIIINHRKAHVSFKEAGENITNKLLSLKKEHRFKELKNTLEKLLKEEKVRKVRKILKEFKREFILILNHCDVSENWLEETIFEFHGQGRGLFSTIGISEEASEEAKREYQREWEINIKFAKKINKLNETEREIILDTLNKVVEQNISLYPTRVSVLCRVSSSDIMPLIEPKKQKKSNSHFPKN